MFSSRTLYNCSLANLFLSVRLILVHLVLVWSETRTIFLPLFLYALWCSNFLCSYGFIALSSKVVRSSSCLCRTFYFQSFGDRTVVQEGRTVMQLLFNPSQGRTASHPEFFLARTELWLLSNSRTVFLYSSLLPQLLLLIMAHGLKFVKAVQSSMKVVRSYRKAVRSFKRPYGHLRLPFLLYYYCIICSAFFFSYYFNTGSLRPYG